MFLGVVFYHFLITNFVFRITSNYNYFSKLIWALQKDGGGNRIHITHLWSYPICETQGSGNTNYKCLYWSLRMQITETSYGDIYCSAHLRRQDFINGVFFPKLEKSIRLWGATISAKFKAKTKKKGLHLWGILILPLQLSSDEPIVLFSGLLPSGEPSIADFWWRNNYNMGFSHTISREAWHNGPPTMSTRYWSSS